MYGNTIVITFKLLDVSISSDLLWPLHVTHILYKGAKQMYWISYSVTVYSWYFFLWWYVYCTI